MPTPLLPLRTRPGSTIELLEARIAPAAALAPGAPAEVVSEGTPAHLVLAIAADTTHHLAHGQRVSYTLTVTNSGDTAADNVVLHVILPTDVAEKPLFPQDGFTDTNFDGTYDLSIGSVPGGNGTVTRTFELNVLQSFGTGFKTLTTEATVTFGQTLPPVTPNLVAPGDSDTDKSISLPLYQGIHVLSSGVAKTSEFGPSDLRVFDNATGEEILDFRAYPNVNGKVIRDSFRVALGDFNNDGFDDIVVSTAHGTGPIRIFNGETGALIKQIAPFNGKKGLFVAAADVTGDGQDDLVLGSALGGGALTVVDGSNYQYLGAPIHPFGSGYRGGVRVAAADFEGPEGNFGRFNNFADEIVAAQGNFGNRVKVYSLGSPSEGIAPALVAADVEYIQRASFIVGGASYRGGLNVAAGDLDGDGVAEIVTGRNRLHSPTIDIFTLQLDEQSDFQTLATTITLRNDLHATSVRSFDAFASSFRQGVRVAIGDLDADGRADLLTSIGYSGNSQARVYSGSLAEGYSIQTSLTVFARPLPALWAAISQPVPAGPFDFTDGGIPA